MYNTILFDLDGTLTDPKIGITKSVQYALAKLDIREPNLDQLVPFIGPPLVQSFKDFYGFTDLKARQAVSYYREYFAKTGIYENAVFPGIPQLLADLCQAGKKLAVATSKPTVFAEQIVKHFHLDGYFELVIGSNLDGTRVNKAEVIQFAVAALSYRNKEELIMVGDRRHDIAGARHNGIDSVAVTYGYGTIAELKEAGPVFLADSVDGLGEILKQGSGMTAERNANLMLQ